MVMGLDPGVSSQTQLWESIQACFQAISTDRGAFFLQETAPSFALLTGAGGHLPFEAGFKATFPAGWNWHKPAAPREPLGRTKRTLGDVPGAESPRLGCDRD